MSLTLYIEGVDVTDDLEVDECVYTDAGPGASDHMEITCSNARELIAWEPGRVLTPARESMRAVRDGVDSGEMEIYAVWPEDGRYVILARAMPEAATRAAWASYERASIGDIMGSLARGLGLEPRCWGIDRDATFRYALRAGESAPAFLERMLTPQAGAVRFTRGALNAIGLEWASAQAACASVELRADGANWRRMESAGLPASCRVITPRCSARAEADGDGAELVITDAPVFSTAEALRWARGALLAARMRQGVLTVECDLTDRIYALGVVETGAPLPGAWLAGDVRHDMKRGRTTATLMRGAMD